MSSITVLHGRSIFSQSYEKHFYVWKKGINSNCSYYGDIHSEQGRGTNIRLILQTLRMRPPLSRSRKDQAHHKSRAHDLLKNRLDTQFSSLKKHPDPKLFFYLSINHKAFPSKHTTQETWRSLAVQSIICFYTTLGCQ